MHVLLLAAVAALPWLQGFFAPHGESERGSRDVVAELARWRAPVEDCVASAYGGLELHAELGPGQGPERVLASYTQGIFVFDRDRHLVAEAPGLPCYGSADELVAMAAGDAAIGTPVIVLAATSGGRAENVTWLTLYRLGKRGELQRAFTGEVERHAGNTTRTGIVTLIPGGLVYRDTRGAIGLWLYDAALGRYVEQFTTRASA